jgi:hypothetical protein
MKTMQLQCSSAGPVGRTLLCLFALCVLRLPANAAEATDPSQRNALAAQQFFCNAGYDHAACLQHAARLKTLLLTYPSFQLGSWSWIIVRSEDWQPLLLRLRLDQRTPAFSALEQRSTFLEEALFHPNPKRADELQGLFHTPADQLLKVAVAHELAHASCHEMDENAANRIADRLLHGQPIDCRAGRGITPIQKLYLDRNSPGQPR